MFDIPTDFQRWKCESEADATGRLLQNKMLNMESVRNVTVLSE